MAQVHHPNVLQIFDLGEIEAPGEDDKKPLQYIVMEYVPGNTLRFTMSEDGFGEDVPPVRDWLRQYFFPVLDGMVAVHANGIVHRDIKPENVLLDGDIPKIADFGLARSVRIRAISDSWDVKGTMHYMAPEQFIDFRKVGPTADIYALGKILYEAVEGKIGPGLVPLKAVNLGNPASPFFHEIDRILRKATAESPAERFQSIAELRAALEGAIRQSEKPTKPRLPAPGQRVVLAAAVLAIASVLAMTVWHLAGNPSGGRASDAENSPRPIAEKPAPTANEPPPEIRGKDGKEMVLVEARPSAVDAGQAFYMDREKVTYYDFVEFLNEVKDRLTVKDGVVESEKGDIWYYLGTGSEPYGQIIYEHDRFLVVDAAGVQGRVETPGLPFLCAVADGIGGHAAGDVASKMACEGLEAFFGQLTKEDFDGRPLDAVHRSLVEAFFAVDNRIGHLAGTEESFAHMGTTLSSILFAGDRAVIAHVGDSRIYRLRADRLVQLTVDHTFVQDLISYGDLTPEQALVHPLKHMLTAAVGTQEPLEEVFYDTIGTESEDRFLLCTDGLHDLLDQESIAEILGRGMGPQETVSMLIDRANDCGGKDNITAVAVFLESRSGDR